VVLCAIAELHRESQIESANVYGADFVYFVRGIASNAESFLTASYLSNNFARSDQVHSLSRLRARMAATNIAQNERPIPCCSANDSLIAQFISLLKRVGNFAVST